MVFSKMHLCLFLNLVFFVMWVKPLKQGEYREKLQVRNFVEDNQDLFDFVKNKSKNLITQHGFNAGAGYTEVWIRDFNTFIELACEIFSNEELKSNLTIFFDHQFDNGSIADGFFYNITRNTTNNTTPFKYPVLHSNAFTWSVGEGELLMFKNTVEQDQESSLIQAVYKYVTLSGDYDFLHLMVNNLTVAERMEKALHFLLNLKWSKEYGLVKGATRVDWGDVQPEDGGIFVNNLTHPAICIYDNAMYLIAIDNFLELFPHKEREWRQLYSNISENTRKFLWDGQNTKYIPHVYLEKGSPFPETFNEDELYYHGGTAIAIEANLLSHEEIQYSIWRMVDNVEKMGAASIGLTVYPCYPSELYFNMNCTIYQNAGDWTWFGGRMIQQLIKHHLLMDAYEQMLPMLKRVKENDDFIEWYDIDNNPRGSKKFKGSAGVLHKAILMMEKALK